MYNENVYSIFSGYTYICESKKQRNALLTFLAKHGIAVPKEYAKAPSRWKYLIIIERLKKVGMYSSKPARQPTVDVSLKTFIKAFGIIKKFYTIYGELIQF